MIINSDGKTKIRYDTETNWSRVNPLLDKGEIIIAISENGSQKIKCGDGVQRYNNLPFISSGDDTTSVSWADIYGKPTTFTPSAHDHDDRYYTESEIDEELNKKQNAISDLEEIRTGASKGATALQEHQDISGKADLSGATFTGMVESTKNDVAFKHTNGSNAIGFGVGSGKVNRGIWDYTNNKWALFLANDQYPLLSQSPPTADNSAKIATTGFVKAQGYLKSVPSNYLTNTSNVQEAYLTWGGKSIAGGVSPNDMGCIDEFGHNKLAFLPAECITVEYSIDGGETWIDYGFIDAEKIALVTTSGKSVIIGGGTVDATKGTLTTENCSNYLARVTISAWKNNNTNGVYTSAVKWLINYSSNGASGGTVKVETRTIGNRLNGVDVWTDRGMHVLSGWSGWNSINIPNLAFGGSTTQTSQIAEFRFTLSIQGVSSNTAQARFIDFRLIGKTNWAMPSEMARAGHLYTVDTTQSATFPATVKATTFTENGTALSSKYLGIKAKAESSKSADSVAWNNVTSKPSTYTPPTASKTTLGGIKVGDNLTIDSDGTLSAVSGATGVTINDVYPVGSIYFSINNTNPSTMFGGTWQSVGDNLKLSSTDYFWGGISIYAWKRTA